MTALKLRGVIAKSAPDLVAVLLAKALAGDTAAATVLLERAMAPVKAGE